MNRNIKNISIVALAASILVCWIGSAWAADGLIININTASVTQLMKIPGIGKKIADRIVQYREKNGPFKTKDDLLKVKGVGSKKFEKIKDLIILATTKKDLK
ncbi:secreted protein containing Competence protein ComEA, helix-hairpin-helix region domain protein [Candidatus Magnetomorum sp. HK-1]|nr:secreted protein containing Competence protein ComEA, helix-hairpin-helix region domain protein [Candidatus Magnetomorum sp. HK-1]